MKKLFKLEVTCLKFKMTQYLNQKSLKNYNLVNDPFWLR